MIKDELAQARSDFGQDRRTELVHDDGEILDLDLIADEPIVITMTRAGYVKALDAGAFRTQLRGGRGVTGAKLKEEDLVSTVLHTTAHAHLLFFSNFGKVYLLRAHQVPVRDRSAKGTPIVNLLPLQPDERIQAVIDTRDFEGGGHLFFATRKGVVKKTALSEYDKSRTRGLHRHQAHRWRPAGEGHQDLGCGRRADAEPQGHGDPVQRVRCPADGSGQSGRPGNEAPAGDEVVSCDVARDEVSILIVTESGYGKRTQLHHFNRQGRGGIGVIGIKLTAKKGKVIDAFMVGLDDEIVAISSNGIVIRTAVREISSQGRDATGVRVMNLDDGDTVAAVAAIEQDPAEE